jgi:DNA adenine methylase
MNYLDRGVIEQSEVVREIVQPFLKWAGGKRWLFRNYRHLFPPTIKRLVDPFIGGGSSFFYLRPSTALLGDLNSDLINVYQVIQQNPASVARRLVHFHHAHNEKFYYKVRASKPTDLTKKAAWSLYLNRTCWNGLFRVNLKGEFNVPIGTKTKVFTSINEFDAASLLLRRSELICSDFEAIIDRAEEGDLVFADQRRSTLSLQFCTFWNTVLALSKRARKF